VNNYNRAALFLEEDEILSYHINHFLDHIVLLVESQGSTQELVIDVLSIMIQIEQGDCGV
jgi:hypothetical protein